MLSRVLFFFPGNRLEQQERGEGNMGIHQKVTGRSSSLGSGIAAGVAVALALTLLLGALLAFFISREVVQQENLGYGVMVILFLAAALGCRLAYRKIKHRRLLVFFLTALGYLVSLTAITALFFGGRFEGIFPTAMLIIGSSGMAFLFPGRRNDAGKHRKIPKQFR